MSKKYVVTIRVVTDSEQDIEKLKSLYNDIEVKEIVPNWEDVYTGYDQE